MPRPLSFRFAQTLLPLLGGAALLASDPSAQSPVPNLLLVGDEGGGSASSWQQDGLPGPRFSASIVGAPRLAPDGSVWARSFFTGVPATAVNFAIPRPGSGWQPRFSTRNIPGAVIDVAVTADSHGVVVTDRQQLIEIDPVAGVFVSTWLLAGPPSTVEVDESGRAWIGIDNQPSPLLQVRDLGTGSSNIVPIPGASGAPTRILPDGRAGGSHVFVSCEATRSVFEFDAGFTLVREHVRDGLPATAGIDELELGPAGGIWALSRGHGLWRFDVQRSTFETILATDRIQSFGFDAHGTLWLAEATVLRSYDPASGLADRGRPLGTGSLAPRMVDPSGHFVAQVLDRQGDSDGDGDPNRVETERGSNPFDPASNLRVDLAAGLDAPEGGEARLALRGDLGVGLVAFGTARLQSPVSVPGILGGFELDPRFLFGTPLSTLTPGTLRIPVPSLSAEVRLMAQALVLPVQGTPRFSDVVPINLRRLTPVTMLEDFQSPAFRDDVTSSGRWGGGALVPSDLGGRGLLGVFDHTLGSADGPGRFVFDTDDQLFPASVTLFGQPVRVTDGVFEFESFHVPAGVTVAFRGSRPAVIRVRGDVQIDGVLDLDGRDQPDDFDGRSVRRGTGFVAVPGQPGSDAGAGGGRGGDGATGSDGQGNPLLATGAAGESIRVSAASGYATVMGRAATAGRGAPPFPLDALDGSITYGLFQTLCTQVGAGGSGGAFLGAGAGGQALRSAAGQASDLGPPTSGGTPLPFLQPTRGAASLDWFLVGGAGGGGGGSEVTGMSRTQLNINGQEWHAGCGGAGGGGALALRVGDDLRVATTGQIRARGGSAGRQTSRSLAMMPGGGGAGGSLLLQATASSLVQQLGVLDVSGGSGGLLRYQEFNGQPNESVGGDGGHGLIRLETPGGAPLTRLGTIQGPPMPGPDNVGDLTDRDGWSGARSRFYPPDSLAAPRWSHYVVRTRQGGRQIAYSDDPTLGVFPNVPGQPLRFYVQGGRFDPSTGEVTAAGPLRDTMEALRQDAATYVRFVILFDRSVAAVQTVEQVLLDAGT